MPPKKRIASEAQLAALNQGRHVFQRTDSATAPTMPQCPSRLNFDGADDVRIQGVVRLALPWLAAQEPHADSKAACLRMLSTDSPASTKSACSEIFGCETRLLVKSQLVLAELLMQIDREVRVRLERSITMSQSACLQYLDIDMSDETPMPVGRRDMPTRNVEPDVVPHVAEQDQLAIWQISGNSKSKVALQPTKILQSRGSYSMLIRTPSGKLAIIRGDTLNALQHVERTTAEVLLEAHRLRSGVTESTNAFEDKVRLTCLDDAKSNPRCETFVMKPRHDWSNLQFKCEDHICFNILGAVGKHCDADVSGQIHWAVALTHPMGRQYIQELVREVCKDWLCIRRGPPPPECAVRLRALLRICLAGETRSFEKQLRILYFPNGDPWLRGQIEVWVPVGSLVSHNAIANAIASSLNFTLFSSMVPIIKRHRWRGLYSGLGAFALHDGFWGLASELFRRFRLRVQRVGQPRKQSTSNSSDAVAQSHVPHGLHGEGHKETSCSDVNDPEHHRSLADMWIRTGPGPRVIILRMALEPLRLYQVSHNKLTSQRYHKECQINDIISLQGEPQSLTDAIPFYKIVSGELESNALDRIFMLIRRPELWESIVPDDSKTIENKCLAFRILSNLGAQMEVKLRGRRHRQPMKTFRVDLEPQVEHDILSEPCEFLHTKWSKKHASLHFGSVSKEARDDGFAKRVHIATEADVTIEVLESIHAQIRRRLKASGVQTHPTEFGELNANWIIDRARSRELAQSWMDVVSPEPVVEHADGGGDGGHNSANDDDRRGGGGAWRAFVRARSFGTKGRPDLALIGEEFAQLSQDELNALLPDARSATQVHRTNTSRSTSSFGPTSKDISRSLESRRRLALQDKFEQDATHALARVDGHIHSESAALEAALAVARQGDGGNVSIALKEGNMVLHLHRQFASKQHRLMFSSGCRHPVSLCSQTL
jgi:hypothetical protein